MGRQFFVGGNFKMLVALRQLISLNTDLQISGMARLKALQKSFVH